VSHFWTPHTRWTHGVYVGGWFPTAAESRAVFVHQSESAASFGVYTGMHHYRDGQRLDIAVDASFGLGEGPISILQVGGTQLSVHAFLGLRDELPLVAGVILTPWVSQVQLGARYRFRDQLDAGLGLNVPVLGVMGPQPDPGNTWLLQPMFDLRVTQ